MTRTIQYTLVLAVIVLLSVLPACTGNDTTVKKIEKEEIKIGYLGALTGGAASVGVPTKDAVALAEAQVNEENLIRGKRLKIIYEDDACDPKMSTTAIQKLITQDNVRAIIGPMCSGPTLADAPIAEESKVLLMSYAATNAAIKDAGDYIFRNVPSDANQGVEGAHIMNELEKKKVAIIHINNEWGVGMKNVFTEEAKALGLAVLQTETYEPDATDFRAQLTKIKAKNPEGIYMLSFPADSGLMLKQMRELGLTVQVVGADGTKDDAVIATAGEAAEGLIVTAPGVPQSPQLEAFGAAYKAKYGKEYQPYTPEAYDVAMIVAKACAETDCTSTAMKDYLYTMGEYAGASGTYTFDENGEVKKAYDRFQVQDGKWMPYGAETAEEVDATDSEETEEYTDEAASAEESATEGSEDTAIG